MNRELKRYPRNFMGYPSTPVPPALVAESWRQSLADFAGGANIVYIHIPYCRSRCHFCPFYLGPASDRELSGYVRLLVRELKTWGPRLGGRTVNSVYLGGGTPSDLSPSQISLLLKTIQRCLPLTNDCEITLESRIDGLSDDKIAAASDGGVNRFSLGVQSFDTKLRQSLGRSSDRAKVLDALSRLTARNQFSVTADLLYGIPGQTPEKLKHDLETMRRETALSGFSFYRLRWHDKLPMAELMRQGKLAAAPDQGMCQTMYHLTEEYMAESGAKRISWKHFSFDARERNLHNEISAAKAPCIPFGIHAGGRLSVYQWKQTDDIAAYRRMVSDGVKPLVSAGRLPEDFQVGAAIAGQLNCRMLLDIDRTLDFAPAMRQSGVRARLLDCCRTLTAQNEMRLTAAGTWMLTAAGRFRCGEIAGDLMAAAALAWEEEKG